MHLEEEEPYPVGACSTFPDRDHLSYIIYIDKPKSILILMVHRGEPLNQGGKNIFV